MQLRTHVVFWFALAGVFALLFWGLKGMLLPFVAGFIVAYLLDPVVERMVAWRVTRTKAAGLILLAFLFVCLLLLALVLPILAREMATLANNVPDLLARAHAAIETRFPIFAAHTRDLFTPDWSNLISQHVAQTLTISAGIVSGVLNGGQAALSVLVFIALMPVVAFYMMVDWPRIIGSIDHLFPRAHIATIHHLLAQIDRRIAGFIRGQIIVCIMLAVYYSLGLSLVGVQYGVLIGLLAGLLSIIPFVGSAFGLITSVIVALFQVPMDGWSVVVLALAVFALGQFVEGNFITPRVVGDRVGLHPLWIIFALLAGAHVAGFVGMLIAVPVAAAVAVLLGFAIDQYKHSIYYQGVCAPTKD